MHRLILSLCVSSDVLDAAGAGGGRSIFVRKITLSNVFSRYYEEDQWEKGLSRNRPSKRSLPRSVNQVTTQVAANVAQRIGQGMAYLEVMGLKPSACWFFFFFRL